MAKQKGSFPVPGHEKKEPARELKKCRYCGEPLIFEGGLAAINTCGDPAHVHICCDCYEIFKMKMGFETWGEEVPAKVIKKAYQAVERYPNLQKKLEQWRKDYEESYNKVLILESE